MQAARALRAPITDLVIATALAAWALATAGGQLAVGIPAALLMTVPLGWRRVWPAGVALLVAAGFALQGAQSDPPESLATLLAAMLAAYSVCAMADRRPAAVGLLALVAAGCAETALVGDNDYGFIIVVIAAAAAAGAAIGARTRQAEADRARDAADAVAAERERIARELHDSVAHAVSLMVVQAGAAETAVDGGDTAKALERIRATGQDAIADLGRMVGLLRNGSNGAEPVYGMAEVQRLIEPFRSAGLAVDLRVDGTPRPLPGGLDSAAFRIAQEALTNALKHGAGSASLTVAYQPSALQLTVHNPVTANGAVGGTGHGLMGMRERARLYGGELRAAPAPDGGFEVSASLPLPPDP